MNQITPAQRRFLHVGCGTKTQAQTTAVFAGADWQEWRLDIDPNVAADVRGSMTDMSGVADASCAGLYSSHNLEHLYAHEVPLALTEFLRVLADDGVAVVTCPDLKSIAALIVQDRLLEPAYDSPTGAISAHDMLYGHTAAMAGGNLFMAHRCGFTLKVLLATLRAAGFASVAGRERAAPYFDLWALASKAPLTSQALRSLARQHFPAAARAGATP